jgi:hypothetical protein
MTQYDLKEVLKRLDALHKKLDDAIERRVLKDQKSL